MKCWKSLSVATVIARRVSAPLMLSAARFPGTVSVSGSVSRVAVGVPSWTTVVTMFARVTIAALTARKTVVVMIRRSVSRIAAVRRGAVA